MECKVVVSSRHASGVQDNEERSCGNNKGYLGNAQELDLVSSLTRIVKKSN